MRKAKQKTKFLGSNGFENKLPFTETRHVFLNMLRRRWSAWLHGREHLINLLPQPARPYTPYLSFLCVCVRSRFPRENAIYARTNGLPSVLVRIKIRLTAAKQSLWARMTKTKQIAVAFISCYLTYLKITPEQTSDRIEYLAR